MRDLHLFRNYNVNNQNYNIYSFLEDKNGRIWIGTFGGGLFYYDQATDSVIPFYSELLNHVNVSSIMEDSWGNPYQYLNFETATGQGQMRKNHMMVPINEDFDLYSMGKDGKSQSPLTAKASRDDIVRGSSGKYIGIASEYS